ncbi:alpha-1,6-mannosyl-glycoprotein 2-beta-N-acetylglucosaminyltransferase-like [Chironomus tepperi]|uniref:alpha-1,6-mannosyl-glycoprotein 2-beta-N-acetylglucosaminyltransferase-like n=1 Tax=Chironomus tepperi TaxID=113505 RepID=UPI00391F558D
MPFIIKKLSRRVTLFAAVLLCTLCFLAFINRLILLEYDLHVTVSQPSLNNSDTKNDSKMIQKLIERMNDEQIILNDMKYETLRNDSIVIVVQVHKRITYLRHLIQSLSQADDISKTLIIFSHDYYDDEINNLVQNIDFCKVMQIFYPYSIQTHPDTFPGTDPKDCDRDISKSDAIKIKCKNAHFPDLYGHYREAKYTQMKHHWWWKLNRIFDELNVTRTLSDMQLLLLEEDYMIAPDFLYILRQMRKLSKRKCSFCNILSLGTYIESTNYDSYNKVEISPWLTSKHNMGMSLNRTTWNDIKSCAKYFCSYDEYNYDWSLQNVNYNCLTNKLFAMIIKSPRVFHIGECGMHHNSENCDPSQATKRIQFVIENAMLSKKFYPKTLRVTKMYDEEEAKDSLKPNGGFADLRDQVLCLNMTTFNTF